MRPVPAECSVTIWAGSFVRATVGVTRQPGGTERPPKERGRRRGRLQLPSGALRRTAPLPTVKGEIWQDHSVTWRWLEDVSPADWVLPRLGEWGCVGGAMPSGYEAYLRLLHPVEDHEDRTRRWSDIAREHGRIAHAGMQLHMINRDVGATAPAGYEPGEGYNSGSLEQPERDLLIDHLVRATATPNRCWFLLWDGNNGVGDDVEAPRVEHPWRLISWRPAHSTMCDGRCWTAGTSHPTCGGRMIAPGLSRPRWTLRGHTLAVH